jgi:hypothetical protein
MRLCDFAERAYRMPSSAFSFLVLEKEKRAGKSKMRKKKQDWARTSVQLALSKKKKEKKGGGSAYHTH